MQDNKMLVRRSEGGIALTVVGAGQLVLCIPGMGETQASFRHLVPRLVDAGYRVVTMDLRGHGGSDATFARYDDVVTAEDALSVIEMLGDEPAAIVGNSMGAAAGVIAAVSRPHRVSKAVLIGPFVRDHGNVFTRFVMRVMLARPWGPAVWRKYYRSLFGDVLPDDHEQHVAAADALLRVPDRWRAFQRTARTSHAPAEAVLEQVGVPVLIVMGAQDPDFPDPQAEAQWIADSVRGQIAMIPGAGHYPMAEQPDAVARGLLPFLAGEALHG